MMMKRMMRNNTIAGWLAVAVLAMAGASARGAVSGAVDLSGHSVEQLAPAGTKAVVLFFVASDCPISNRYIPEIEKLSAEYGPRGVLFWWIYPNPGDTAAVVKAHDAQFSIGSGTLVRSLLDARQSLVRMAHVTITPEAAVFVPAASGLREVYRGRIDNRYIDFGQERPSATQHDLEEAIRAVLDHKIVPPPGGPPVGCSIVTTGVALQP
jgi:thiol-disulfide isomerase/thioredoxin